ncbi:N-acetylmuramoyl-L-alanine amidase [Streptomyces sp. NPDC059637]|uniref:N-acetylmuramoyl-L-alanine amidase n=1 Tax=Streptomyces sp. NPDC059637 TaxID=3347752 RepID=UPI0036C59000
MTAAIGRRFEPSRRPRWAAALCAAVAAALALTAQPATAAPPDAGTRGTAARDAAARNADAAQGPVGRAFSRAAAEFDVPRDLLVAVGYGETHLDDHDGEPSHAGGYGVMHLVSVPGNRVLERAARATGETVSELKHDTAANIRGGAAVLRAHADAAGLDASDRNRPGAWYPAVVRYGGATEDRTARLYADTVYEIMAEGVLARLDGDELLHTRARKTEPERGRYEDVPEGFGGEGASEGEVGAQSTDYPAALWNPAYSGNYTVGRTSAINKVVVHVTQGSYAGAISWFQNPSAQVSAHYVIRSSDGQITQSVRNKDTAWHARSANSSSLGIEHEGYVTNPSWFTDAMYRASAALTRHLCDQYGIPKDRLHILGHNELPDNDHTDPGQYWDWAYYMQLVRGDGNVSDKTFTTWGSGVNVRSAPTTTSTAVASLAGPTTVRVRCQVRGQLVTYQGYTNDAWAYLPDYGGYISNIFVNTPESWLPGVPTC